MLRQLWRRQWVLILLGLGLMSPALWTGFFCDDYLQLAQLEGWAPNRVAATDLYDFVPDDPVRVRHFFDIGENPWWAAPDLKLVFFRPLTSALLAVDHRLFGREPLPYHLHTLAWYAGLLIVGAAVLRRALAPGAATLALFLFVADTSHAMPAVWIAARHGTVSMVLVLLGLLAHQRWRQERWRPGAVLAPLAVALGLLAGETGLAVTSYLVAWELAERRPGWRRALVPYAILLVGYVIAYRLWGAGTRGSGLYLDPLGGPLAYLLALPGRVALLLSGALLGAPTDLTSAFPGARPWYMLVGALVGAGVAFWTFRVWKDLPADDRRAVVWLTAGALIGLALAAAALPGQRVLLPSGLGFAALLAVLLRHAFLGWRTSRAPLRVAAVALAIPRVVLAVPLTFLAAVGLPDLGKRSEAMARAAEVDGPGVAYVVLLQTDEFFATYIPLLRPFVDRASIGQLSAWHLLSLAPTDHVVSRPDENTLVLSTPRGSFVDGAWPALFRSPDRPLARGTTVTVPAFTATVLEDRQGRPTKVEFRFARSLEHGTFRFLEWRDGAYRRARLPPVGGTRPIQRGPAIFP